MLHPSYTELMDKINKEETSADEPVINSRYSIVIATSRRARELIAGGEPLIDAPEGEKPLSIAVKELYEGEIKILPESEEAEEEDEFALTADEDWETPEEAAEEAAEE